MPPPAVREGGEKFLKLTPSQKKTVRHQFDSFCKKILREEARDYIRHISWRYEHEISMSELSEKQMKRFCILDEYPSEQFHFHVQGINIALRDEILANALVSLSDEKRDIVLLSYLLDMTDQEIANKLNIVRRTVQYKRTNSLKEMKRRMDVLEYGKKFD